MGFSLKSRRSRGEGPSPSGKSISSGARSKQGKWFLAVFFSFFFLIGAAFLWFIFLSPALKVRAARTWVEVPCTIISSEVVTHSGSDGSTYGVKISFSYLFEGHQYRHDRYGFVGGSSSGRQGKQAVVSAHPPGSKRVCYVDPEAPYEAVLNRGMQAEMWFGLIPLVFVVIGLGGILGVLRSALKPKRRPFSRSTTTEDARATSWDESAHAGAITLKASGTRLGKLFGVLFAAVFWNGIVSVFVWQAVQAWRRGRPEWFLMVFLIPFVLIGLFLTGAIFHQLLALFNPQIRIEIDPGHVRVGETIKVRWSLHGQVSRLKRMTIRIEGVERATYRRGTNTHTDEQIFATHTVMDSAAYREMRKGSETVTIPVDTMHSFDASNNKIVWQIRVNGEIPKWPDVDETFPLMVTPGQVAEIQEGAL